MSAVTSQAAPFGQLEREKHIQMIFKAYKNRCGPSYKGHTGELPDWGSDEQLSDWTLQEGMKDLCVQTLGGVKSLQVEEQKPEDAGGLDFMSVLVTVRQILITARPELQGPQCVSRRTYSITTGGRRSQQFVAVEGGGACSLFSWRFVIQKEPPKSESCCRCSFSHQFQVDSNIGERVGTIWKKWPGFNDEQNMDHEYVGLDVSPNLESQTKLLLLAATFLLNHVLGDELVHSKEL